MTTWTTINKPSGTSWTTVTKPVGTTSVVTVTYSGGTPIGLLLALTQSSVIGTSIVTTDKWTTVTKASGTSWTTYPKAT